MKLKKMNSFLTTFYAVLFVPLFTFAQNSNENQLATAIQLFDSKKYEEAEHLFKNELTEKPDDFMINYFYGASRTENNHFTNFDLECLIKANQEVSPININYYFGVQYHARSNWERALKFYNKYNASSSLARDEKTNLLSKIQQCYDKINPYEEYMVPEVQEITTLVPDKDSISGNGSLEMTDTLSATFEEEEESPLTIEELPDEEYSLPEGDAIQFEVNNDIFYLYTSQFKTEEGKTFFEKGNTKQKELDSALERSSSLRLKYKNSTSAQEKKLIGQEILSLENATYSLKKEVASLLYQSKNMEDEYWRNAGLDEIKTFHLEQEKIKKVQSDKLKIPKQTEIDSSTFIDPNILMGNKEATVTFSENEPVNNDLVYKIQIGSYSRGLPDYIKRLHKKLSYIRKIENYTDDKGVVVYTTGNLTNLEDAEKMKKQVQQEGVERPSVVPYFKGKRITLAQAKELQAK